MYPREFVFGINNLRNSINILKNIAENSSLFLVELLLRIQFFISLYEVDLKFMFIVSSSPIYKKKHKITIKDVQVVEIYFKKNILP